MVLSHKRIFNRNIQRNFEGIIIADFIVSTLPNDSPVPFDARTFTTTIIANVPSSVSILPTLGI